MNIKRKISWFILLFVLINCPNIFACEACRRTKIIGGPEKQFSKLEDLMPKTVFNYYKWPSPETLKKMTVFDKSILSVGFASKTFLNWQNRVLSTNWTPTNNAKWLFIGENAMIPCDSIWVKWKKAEYDVMQVQTKSFLLLKITLLNEKSFGQGKDERISNLKKLTVDILQKQNLVEKELRFKINNYYKGINDNFLLPEVRSFTHDEESFLCRIHAGYGSGSRWYEMINWFSYNNVYCLYFLKETGDEAITFGYQASDWFSIGSRAVFLIGEKAIYELGVNRDGKIMVRPKYKDGKWTVTFNLGTDKEMTVIIDSLTGKVLEVLDKNKKKIK
ncbi:MAG: hypothetical protein WC071_12125 [Victivallaceae bacterium]